MEELDLQLGDVMTDEAAPAAIGRRLERWTPVE
jgi:hypothetical protein